MSNSNQLKEVRLKVPAELDDLKQLEIGNVVYLDGHVALMVGRPRENYR